MSPHVSDMSDMLSDMKICKGHENESWPSNFSTYPWSLKVILYDKLGIRFNNELKYTRVMCCKLKYALQTSNMSL